MLDAGEPASDEPFRAAIVIDSTNGYGIFTSKSQYRLGRSGSLNLLEVAQSRSMAAFWLAEVPPAR